MNISKVFTVDTI